MRKFVVPIDFSDHAEYALKAAAMLAKTDGSEILALHMLELSDSHYSTTDDDQLQEMVFFLKLARQRFEEFLQKPYLNGIKVIPIVKHFKVFHEVNDIALSHSADMIIMGSHGVSGVKEFMLGSNTEKVIRHAEIPVLVLKNEINNVAFQKVVFITNFEKSAVKAYQTVKSFSKSWGSELLILYVNLPNERFLSSDEITDKSKTFLNACGEKPEDLDRVFVQSDYSVEKGVFNFSNKIDADLLVVPTHGRKGLSHFFAGSLGEDIANHSKLPVMTIKLEK